MPNEASKDLGVIVIGVLGFFALLALSVAWGGFWAGLAASVLWGWFVVPAFGLPDIGIAHGLGLALVLRAFIGYRATKGQDESAGTLWAKGVFLPPFACGLSLLVGLAIKGMV